MRGALRRKALRAEKRGAPHRSSHHAFSRFTSSSSSGVKSFLMLNRMRISSGVLPLISSATVLQVRSSSCSHPCTPDGVPSFEISAFVALFDGDGDGKISWEDFSAMLGALDAGDEAMPQELQRSQQQARQLEALLNTSRAEYEAKFSILQRINDSLREDLLALQTQGGLLNCTPGGRLSRIVEELEKRAEELQSHNHLPPDHDARRRDITISLVRAEGRIRQLESREQQLMEQLENVTQELRSARVRIEQLEEVRAAEDRVTGNPTRHQGMWPSSTLVSLPLDSDAIAVQRRARRMAERQHWHCAARHWDQLEAANRLLEGSRCSPISNAPAAPSLQ